MSAAVLQKYDIERDKAQCNRIASAAWGGETKDGPPPVSPNGRKQTMSQQDLMRNYGKVNG